MKNTVHKNSVKLVNADSLEYLKTLPDNCIDLIATDPPYFRVKACAWDNQWEDETAYLAWLDDLLAEFWRVLKPSGSMYMFCGSRLAADTEILVRQRMKVLNHIVWAKPFGPWRRMRKEDLRTFFPATERIIFAEHYGAEGYAKGQSGYSVKCKALRQEVFKPLISYFSDARKALGVSAAEINEVTGTKMCSHWFSASQWQLPSESQYLQLQALFQRKAAEIGHLDTLQQPHNELIRQYQGLQAEYAGLVAQYGDLKKQYENLRRPFSVTVDTPHTDVWTFPPVQAYLGKHPCEKPAELMEHIIATSSRPGDVVADFFMGSGSTIKAALKLGRRAIGVELEEETFLKVHRQLKDDE
ncbi:site-specific DNA-methyltransferase [Plesiomonas shigelloides]|uniref:DNA-methyltransferase n=1 Tax=Plesiomonas shigelloides TaxID=703 RepID=UPI001780F3DF|nr:site-specific DNA-methyltransferase [Plesiomonas shigelloides]QOH78616.1 site-specific DNA-methyltransferase [Plesiomonas shigelloides]